ncbi:peptidase S8/S53 domain-containing protein [Scenedesmus sp. NREL 46B-D3]|nr:peptidase S8/S53 domain-containing protein [Scenedesmus sp. NREL 46B-D3]
MDHLRFLLVAPVLFALTCPSTALQVQPFSIRSVAGTVRSLHTTSELDAGVKARQPLQVLQTASFKSTMRAGVSTLPDNIRPALVTAFTNLGCNVRSARYVWKGRLCRGSASAINYTEVAAVDRRSNAPLRSSRGALCRLRWWWFGSWHYTCWSSSAQGATAAAGRGHGTHVAGIVGAKNDNSGVVGVAPGVDIYSLKVLNAQGVGSLSDALEAVSWAAGPEGKAAGIRVINLSLAVYIDPAAAGSHGFLLISRPAYAAGLLGQLAPALMVQPTLSRKYGQDVRGSLPAACPTVIAVTSVDPQSGTPSSFSNFLSEPATMAEKGGIMAAPGNAIKSTISYAREASGYRELSGTSMAAPHIAGVAAACLACGACAEATGYANSALLQAAARERLGAQPAYGFSGDSRTRDAARYYGNLAFAKWPRRPRYLAAFCVTWARHARLRVASASGQAHLRASSVVQRLCHSTCLGAYGMMVVAQAHGMHVFFLAGDFELIAENLKRPKQFTHSDVAVLDAPLPQVLAQECIGLRALLPTQLKRRALLRSLFPSTLA